MALVSASWYPRSPSFVPLDFVPTLAQDHPGLRSGTTAKLSRRDWPRCCTSNWGRRWCRGIDPLGFHSSSALEASGQSSWTRQSDYRYHHRSKWGSSMTLLLFLLVAGVFPFFFVVLRRLLSWCCCSSPSCSTLFLFFLLRWLFESFQNRMNLALSDRIGRLSGRFVTETSGFQEQTDTEQYVGEDYGQKLEEEAEATNCQAMEWQ